MEKSLLGFCGGNQGDANVWVGLHKYVIPVALQNVHNKKEHFDFMLT